MERRRRLFIEWWLKFQVMNRIIVSFDFLATFGRKMGVATRRALYGLGLPNPNKIWPTRWTFQFNHYIVYQNHVYLKLNTTRIYTHSTHCPRFNINQKYWQIIFPKSKMNSVGLSKSIFLNFYFPYLNFFVFVDFVIEL